ncbi:MAG: dicarboxylate/amino acid:cation symporter, partial [Limisphaerales bacterium]
MKTPWYRKLHWQIVLALILGTLFGIFAASRGWAELTKDWISPFGTLFITLLKLIAVPLVITSLVGGVASLSDVRKLSRMGGKTIAIYLTTTAVAVVLGLLLVNLAQPGKRLPAETRAELEATHQQEASGRQTSASAVQQRGPLTFLTDMVPDNFFGAASNNGAMLQVVCISLLLGVGLTLSQEAKRRPVLALMDGLMEAVIQIVHLIMRLAPVGVFALMANTMVTLAK